MASALVVGSVAQAAVVYDKITVYDQCQTVISSLTATPAEIALSPCEIFAVPTVAVDIGQLGNYGMVISGSTPVDIFGLYNTGTSFVLAFAPGGQAVTYNPQNTVDDTGLPISLTQYLFPAMRDAGDTAVFTASGDFLIDAVPEPATWLMLIAGIGGIGLILRRGKMTAGPSEA